jgi:hypothetical protein
MTSSLGNFKSPLNELKSSVDVVAALHSLIDMARNGRDVQNEISECLALAENMGCKSAVDVMSFMSIARLLYIHGMEFAQQNHPATPLFLIEGDRYYDRAMNFLEVLTDRHMPTDEERRKRMN